MLNLDFRSRCWRCLRLATGHRRTDVPVLDPAPAPSCKCSDHAQLCCGTEARTVFMRSCKLNPHFTLRIRGCLRRFHRYRTAESRGHLLPAPDPISCHARFGRVKSPYRARQRPAPACLLALHNFEVVLIQLRLLLWEEYAVLDAPFQGHF